VQIQIIIIISFCNGFIKYLSEYWLHFRDAPEATGEEADDADFDMPKIYEPVCLSQS